MKFCRFNQIEGANEICSHEPSLNINPVSQWSLCTIVTDPGLLRGGTANPRGRGGPTYDYDFAKFSQKRHEIERGKNSSQRQFSG